MSSLKERLSDVARDHANYPGIEQAIAILESNLRQLKKFFYEIDINGSLSTSVDLYEGYDQDRDEKQYRYLFRYFSIIQSITERYFSVCIDEERLSLASYLYLHSCLQSAGADMSIKCHLRKGADEQKAYALLFDVAGQMTKIFNKNKQARQLSWHGRRPVIMAFLDNAIYSSGQILFMVNKPGQDDSYNKTSPRRLRQIRKILAPGDDQSGLRVEKRSVEKKGLSLNLENPSLGDAVYHVARLIRSGMFDPPAGPDILDVAVISEILRQAKSRPFSAYTPEQIVGVMANLAPAYLFDPVLFDRLVRETGLIEFLPNYPNPKTKISAYPDYAGLFGRGYKIQKEGFNKNYPFMEEEVEEVLEPRSHFSYLMRFCLLTSDQMKKMPFEAIKTMIC